MSPKPLLKWAGGKTQLLPELVERAGWLWADEYGAYTGGRYFEPFVGGGALFFELASINRRVVKDAVLGDINPRLMNVYRSVRDYPKAVAGHLRGTSIIYGSLSHAKRTDLFNSIRSVFNDEPNCGSEQAARFILLNRTCFNGLYRENQAGYFNVPHGRYKNPCILDAENIEAVSKVLRDVYLRRGDFEWVVNDASPGDFVYFDPPYVPASTSADFTSYTSSPFGLKEQVRLRDVARDLKRRGAHVLLSNSDTQEVWKLYSKGFEIKVVEARRSINSKASRRGKVGELLIW